MENSLSDSIAKVVGATFSFPIAVGAVMLGNNYSGISNIPGKVILGYCFDLWLYCVGIAIVLFIVGTCIGLIFNSK